MDTNEIPNMHCKPDSEQKRKPSEDAPAAACSAHTAGTWRVENDPCHYGTLSTVTGGDRRHPQLVAQVGGCARLKELEANTRLIAAAPELLDALEEIIATAVHHPDLLYDCIIAQDSPVRAAIARAKQNDQGLPPAANNQTGLDT